jgi:hypothetical protein
MFAILQSAMLIALTFFGGKGLVQVSAASNGPSKSESAAAPGGTRKEILKDPALNNMDAAAITIPAKWHFQGKLVPGGSCDTMPYVVFRTSSPDGLSFVERLPALSWRWGTGPMATKNGDDCLPLQKALSGPEFLKYLATILKVEYVADVPVPAEVNAEVKKQAQSYDASYSMMTSKNYSERAAAIVRYKNGTFVMKGLLSTQLDCHELDWNGAKSTFPGRPGTAASVTHKCTAGVRYLAAPEAQYDAVKKMWDVKGMGGKWLEPWTQALQQRQKEQGDAMLAQQRQMIGQQNKMLAQQAQQQNAQMQAQHQQFEQSQAMRQHMHEDFMSTMQRGTNMSMNRTQQNMNARSTATSDWVDYALDRQTVKDPNTGQVSKVSSSYSNTWIDSTGKVSYQTKDVNANPNGVLPGNWTRQATVHGDGTQ